MRMHSLTPHSIRGQSWISIDRDQSGYDTILDGHEINTMSMGTREERSNTWWNGATRGDK